MSTGILQTLGTQESFLFVFFAIKMFLLFDLKRISEKTKTKTQHSFFQGKKIAAVRKVVKFIYLEKKRIKSQ
jgi:hypothetical protein